MDELFSNKILLNSEINIKLPWIEKYRPINCSEIILDSFIKDKINFILESKNIPNMIITGEPGTGKTSTILFLAKHIYTENYSEYVLELNASDDKGLPIINNVIYPFCKKKTTQTKLIILDEADSITSKAQNLLSNILSEFINTTRFVFICNNYSQIIESIQSKCMIIKYPKITYNNLFIKVEEICKNENILYDINGINTLLFVSMNDIRQIINNLECIYYSYGSLTEENIYKIIDKPKTYYIKKIIKLCFFKKFKDILIIINELIIKGYTSNDIILTFMKYIFENNELDTDLLKYNNNLIIDFFKIKLYEILSEYYIIINENIDSILQLYGCISNIYLYINK
jgi:replication factor C subunit 2/4